MDTETRAVDAFYSVGDLGPAILRALEEAGKDPAVLDPEDLEPVDAFHMRGHDVTRELAEAAGLSGDEEILDVGCGLGGTARCLAAGYGCQVTGVDIVDEYCRVARVLTARTSLDAETSFRQGNALDLPFEDGSFDVVWTEHVQMNVADKETFYREIARVLVPGGRLVFSEVFRGPGGEAVLPAPWADDTGISFLATPEETREAMAAAGLEPTSWTDSTPQALDWFRGMVERVEEDGLPPLGLHLVMGEDALEKARNQVRNLAEDRVVVVDGIAEVGGSGG